MNQDKLVRFHVYDTDEMDVGRIVIDIERMIDIYFANSVRRRPQGNEVEGDVIKEQTTAPRGEQDQFVERVTEHVGWWRKKSDGSLYMKRRPI